MLFAMSQKELNRVDVIRDVCEKRLTQVNASNILNLTRRQVQRLVNNFRKNGAQGLASFRSVKQ
ncbi:Putative phage intergrase, partial [Moritella viscosa]|uniref:helix-turn-helix domain-containing protein n=1 Tax=Moritella viscosa TaxID=80854 RepID=UPI000912CB66